jgi:hypothetical protein
MKKSVLLLVVLVAFAVTLFASQRPARDDGSEVNPRWATLENQAADMQTSENADLEATSFRRIQNEVRVRRLRTSVAEMLGDAQVATLDFDNVRLAKTEAGSNLWLVAGRNIRCLVVGLGLGVSCTSTERAERKGIAVGLVKAPSPTKAPRWFRLAGMVPDGVRAVRARVGRKTLELPVRDNTFEHRARQPILVYGVIER